MTHEFTLSASYLELWLIVLLSFNNDYFKISVMYRKEYTINLNDYTLF